MRRKLASILVALLLGFGVSSAKADTDATPYIKTPGIKMMGQNGTTPPLWTLYLNQQANPPSLNMMDGGGIAVPLFSIDSNAHTMSFLNAINGIVNLNQPANNNIFVNQDVCNSTITGTLSGGGAFPCFQSTLTFLGTGSITNGGHGVAIKPLIFHTGTGAVYQAFAVQPSIQLTASGGSIGLAVFNADDLQGIAAGASIGTLVGHGCTVPNPAGVITTYVCMQQNAVLPITNGGSIGTIYLIQNLEPSAQIYTLGAVNVGGTFATNNWFDQNNGTFIALSPASNPLQFLLRPSSGQTSTILWETAGTGAAAYELSNNGGNSFYGYDHFINTSFLSLASGNLTLGETGKTTTLSGAILMPNLPTSGSGGGLYACVDTAGNTYRKSACP